ncbi:Crp/Fnr family transcriptional regulator [Streptomyces sp. NPDC052101]|uniref:Crp/Fnr family transcriptional regulator n=1 Tax=Streptomyces sp. NPDC052101 TaxID=3155763 RepID=UPI003416E8E9
MTQSWYTDDRAPFLDTLPEALRAGLRRLGSRRHYAPRDALISEGETTCDLMLLHEGIVKVTVRSDGGRPKLMDIRIAGDVVGEMAATDRKPRSATVTACGDVVATVIPQDDLRRFLSATPEAWQAYCGLFSSRLRRANRRFLDFAGYPVRVRLARVLVELAESYGRRGGWGELLIDVNLTQDEFAALAGSTRDTVQKELAQLRRDGLIRTGSRHTCIRDLRRLRETARLG